ncbi:hypothetical protein [Amycolatopsis sp.]|uniref:hypothetical protein n=1 Tax=Amycolatopsis sp. TaxID=37632 RepID=UPI002E09E1FA|nr:hypothetical protein [Amycolatopsis sp.]
MPVYDAHSMGIAAGQVERLKDEFEKSKGKVTGVDDEKDSPFGSMGGSGDVHSAVGTFKEGVHNEFDAGGKLMEATSFVLRKAAGLIEEADQIAKDNVTLHQDRPKP